MDQFLNPVFVIKLIKNYFIDTNRIFKASEKDIERYQNKTIKQVVKNAFSVPLYHEKYKKAGINPTDIKGVKDLKKLPFITKDDLRRNFPNGIIPQGFDKNNGYLISTSGSTGKPVFIFCDKYSSIKRLFANIIELKAYGGNWFKSKIALIIDLDSGSVESTVLSESIYPFIRRFLPLKNLKYLHINKKPEILINELDDFQPEFIGTDPNVLRELAFFKNQGFGKNINPRIIISSGAMLDNYTRNYVQKAFDSKVVDVYGSTEAGSIAFECLNGKYHVLSDFVYLEFLDENNQYVKFGKLGKLVVTRLYGNGTPIIRYLGNEDYLIPIQENCDCGLNTQFIKQIEGRQTDMIILPDGRMFSPLNLTGIPAKIMDRYKTYKIKQFQIIQHTKNKVEVLVVIDDKLRNVGPKVDIILKEMKNRFQEKIGSSIDISIKEVKEIERETRSDYIKVVISKVKQ